MQDIKLDNERAQNNIARRLMVENALVFLVKGQENNKAAWAYIRVKREKLPLLKHAMTKGRLDVGSIGEKLVSGWGKEPPVDIQMRMKHEYGVQ